MLSHIAQQPEPYLQCHLLVERLLFVLFAELDEALPERRQAAKLALARPAKRHKVDLLPKVGFPRDCAEAAAHPAELEDTPLAVTLLDMGEDGDKHFDGQSQECKHGCEFLHRAGVASRNGCRLRVIGELPVA